MSNFVVDWFDLSPKMPGNKYKCLRRHMANGIATLLRHFRCLLTSSCPPSSPLPVLAQWPRVITSAVKWVPLCEDWRRHQMSRSTIQKWQKQKAASVQSVCCVCACECVPVWLSSSCHLSDFNGLLRHNRCHFKWNFIATSRNFYCPASCCQRRCTTTTTETNPNTLTACGDDDADKRTKRTNGQWRTLARRRQRTAHCGAAAMATKLLHLKANWWPQN